MNRELDFDTDGTRRTKAGRIAFLNDLARTAMGVAGRVVQTPGITALPPSTQSRIREQVELFNTFTNDNDPHGEHDFGSFEVGGERVFWKIDYYDKSLEYGSEDPSDPGQTVRVLTIMLANEDLMSGYPPTNPTDDEMQTSRVKLAPEVATYQGLTTKEIHDRLTPLMAKQAWWKKHGIPTADDYVRMNALGDVLVARRRAEQKRRPRK